MLEAFKFMLALASEVWLETSNDGVQSIFRSATTVEFSAINAFSTDSTCPTSGMVTSRSDAARSDRFPIFPPEQLQQTKLLLKVSKRVSILTVPSLP